MAGGQSHYFTVTIGLLHVSPAQRYWLEAHRRKAVRLLALQCSDRFVDLGCGEGYLTLHLSQWVDWSLSIDLAASALNVLQGQPDYDPHRVHLIVGSGSEIPLADSSVDKLLCNHVLEHVLDDDAVMQEVHRIVHPGGLVLVGVPLALSPQIRFLLRLRRLLRPNARRLQLERVKPGHLVPELIGRQSHIRFYTLSAVRALLERNSFHVLHAEGIGMSLRGQFAGLFRRHPLLFGLSTAVGRILPGLGDSVYVLAERARP
jgi:SAM-dependent methyltransferase